MSIPETDPANSGRQALKMNALAGHVQPMMQMAVVGEDLTDLRVGLVDVLGIARERSPAEGADAAAEERADVGRDEARERESVLHTGIECDLPQVVAIVEDRDSRAMELQHRFHMLRH